jgi:hypothetical protein
MHLYFYSELHAIWLWDPWTKITRILDLPCVLKLWYLTNASTCCSQLSVRPLVFLISHSAPYCLLRTMQQTDGVPICWRATQTSSTWRTNSLSRPRATTTQVSSVGGFPPPFITSSGVHRNFVRGGGGSKNSVEDRGQTERGSGSGSLLVSGSGGSCNLVPEILFHKVIFS